MLIIHSTQRATLKNPPRYFPIHPVDPDRSSVLREAIGLCRCARVSADGIKWRGADGQWQTATWEEVDRGRD